MTTTVGSDLFFSIPMPTTMVSYLQDIGRLHSIPGLRNVESCGALQTFYANTSPTASPTLTASCTTSTSSTTLYTTLTSTCEDGEVLTSSYATSTSAEAMGVRCEGGTVTVKNEKRQVLTSPAVQQIGGIPGDGTVWGATWLEVSTAGTRTVREGSVVGSGGAAETGI